MLIISVMIMQTSVQIGQTVKEAMRCYIYIYSMIDQYIYNQSLRYCFKKMPITPRGFKMVVK